MTPDEQEAFAEVVDLISELSARVVTLELDNAAMKAQQARDRLRQCQTESMVIKLAGEWVAGVSDDANCSAPGEWRDGDC